MTTVQALPEGTPEPPAAVPDVPIKLHADEQVIVVIKPSAYWTLTSYVLTLGLWAIWRNRHLFILTNERIVLTKGVITKTERSAPLSRIQDAQLVRSPFTGSRLLMSTAGGGLGVNAIGPLTQADAVAFHDALTPLLGTRPDHSV